jgi:hypothetical protein
MKLSAKQIQDFSNLLQTIEPEKLAAIMDEVCDDYSYKIISTASVNIPSEQDADRLYCMQELKQFFRELQKE